MGPPSNVSALPELIWQARAMLTGGMYQEALEMHRHAIYELGLFIQEIGPRDPRRAEKWAVVQGELQAEASLAAAICSELEQLPPQLPRRQPRNDDSEDRDRAVQASKSSAVGGMGGFGGDPEAWRPPTAEQPPDDDQANNSAPSNPPHLPAWAAHRAAHQVRQQKNATPTKQRQLSPRLSPRPGHNNGGGGGSTSVVVRRDRFGNPVDLNGCGAAAAVGGVRGSAVKAVAAVVVGSAEGSPLAPAARRHRLTPGEEHQRQLEEERERGLARRQAANAAANEAIRGGGQRGQAGSGCGAGGVAPSRKRGGAAAAGQPRSEGAGSRPQEKGVRGAAAGGGGGCGGRKNRAGAGAGAGRAGGAGGGGGGGAGEHNKAKFSEVCEREGRAADVALAEAVERDLLLAGQAGGVTWDQVADLGEAKDLLQEAVVLPLWMPDYFKGIRRPWRGVLMFGPPGTGKTLLAKAVATECGTTFFNISASTLASKWRGESEKMVRLLFECARYHAPSTVFFDEVDSCAGARGGENENEASRRVKTELMVQMDGAGNGDASSEKGGGAAAGGSADVSSAGGARTVIVLAATNRPWDLDEAMRRRFEKRIFIPLPTSQGRAELFSINMKGVPLAEDVDLPELAALCEEYSGADIACVCRDASMMSMRRLMDQARLKARQQQPAAQQQQQPSSGGGFLAMKGALLENKDALQASAVAQADFLLALKKVSKSVGKEDLARFQNWMDEFGSA